MMDPKTLAGTAARRRVIGLASTGERYIPIRDESTGKLLCRYDPYRHLLQFALRGRKIVVDLIEFDIDKAQIG